MGEMKRAISRDAVEALRDRFASTIAICASIIAAVRLAREPNLTAPTPRVVSAVADSITLAKMILRRVIGS